MISLEELQELLNMAYFYLKFRMRTESEMRNYLLKKIQKKHWSSDDVVKVIEKLKEDQYVDDRKFIDMYVRDRTLLKPKGKRALIAELIKHGVAKDMIDEYFSGREMDEESLAYETLVKRWSRLEGLPREKKFEKSIRFLLSRGFDYSTARRAFEKLNSKV